MWKITLCCNVLVMSLLWSISLVAITPANNLLVQYAEFKMDLPLLTHYPIQIHTLTVIIPLSWIVVTFIIAKRMTKLTENTRSE